MTYHWRTARAVCVFFVSISPFCILVPNFLFLVCFLIYIRPQSSPEFGEATLGSLFHYWAAFYGWFEKFVLLYFLLNRSCILGFKSIIRLAYHRYCLPSLLPAVVLAIFLADHLSQTKTSKRIPGRSISRTDHPHNEGSTEEGTLTAACLEEILGRKGAAEQKEHPLVLWSLVF